MSWNPTTFFWFTGGTWSPHKVELAVWTHYIANDLKPELLSDLPSAAAAAAAAAAATASPPAPPAPSLESSAAEEVAAEQAQTEVPSGKADPSEMADVIPQQTEQKSSNGSGSEDQLSSQDNVIAKAPEQEPQAAATPMAVAVTAPPVNGEDSKNGHNEDSSSSLPTAVAETALPPVTSAEQSQASEAVPPLQPVPVNGTNGNGVAAKEATLSNGSSEKHENGTATKVS